MYWTLSATSTNCGNILERKASTTKQYVRETHLWPQLMTWGYGNNVGDRTIRSQFPSEGYSSETRCWWGQLMVHLFIKGRRLFWDAIARDLCYSNTEWLVLAHLDPPTTEEQKSNTTISGLVGSTWLACKVTWATAAIVSTQVWNIIICRVGRIPEAIHEAVTQLLATINSHSAVVAWSYVYPTITRRNPTAKGIGDMRYISSLYSDAPSH